MEPGCAQWQDQRKWTQIETQNAPSDHQNTVFTLKMTEHWYRLPRKVVESPSLELFKGCMNMVLAN